MVIKKDFRNYSSIAVTVNTRSHSYQKMRETSQGVPRGRGRNDTPPIVAGFIEGLLAPILELFSALILSAAQSSSTSFFSTGIIASDALVLLLVDFTRNVIIGSSRSQFAVGNIVGNVFGLLIFGGVVLQDSGEAIVESVFLTAALLVSFLLSVYLTLRD
jgi:hypothetical protein